MRIYEVRKYLNHYCYSEMKCLLIWEAAQLFLYRCPEAMSPPGGNCTIVHQGTYDAEFMAMCTLPIVLHETTTQIPMETVQTSTSVLSPSPAYDISPSPSLRHVETTTQTSVEDRASPSPSTGTPTPSRIETTPFPSQTSTTTQRPEPDLLVTPSPVPQSDATFIPSNQPQPQPSDVSSSHTLAVVAVVVSVLSILGCFGSLAYILWRHKHSAAQKAVRPSQVDIQLAVKEALNQMTDVKTIEDSMKANEHRMKKMRHALRATRTIHPNRDLPRQSPPTINRTTKPTPETPSREAPTLQSVSKVSKIIKHFDEKSTK